MAITNYLIDRGELPKKDGMSDVSELSNELTPFYINTLPANDPWGNYLPSILRETCNGKYGLTGCSASDFLVVCYGRDGQLETWSFDVVNPEAGLFTLHGMRDMDRDFVVCIGMKIRALQENQ